MALDIVALLVGPETALPCIAGAVAAAAVDVSNRVEAFHVRLKPESSILPTEEILTAARREQLEAAAATKSDQLLAVLRTWQKDRGPSGATVQWQEVRADSIEEAVVTRGGRADLVVLARPVSPEGDAALLAAIFKTGRPLLLVPGTAGPVEFGRHLAVAWKAGPQMERATAAALPWLRRAGRISVLVVDEGEAGDASLPPDLASLQLANPGLVSINVLNRGEMTVGQRLLDAAKSTGADGMVLGAYQHHRIVEKILGGVTQELLGQAQLPLFLMH